jgi:hypothetical protein
MIKSRAARDPAIKLRKVGTDARFMDPDTPQRSVIVVAVEAPQQVSVSTTTRSVAVVIKAPPSALHAVPPSEFDGHIEEAMDYSSVPDLAAPDHPAEEWPGGSGPLGF